MSSSTFIAMAHALAAQDPTAVADAAAQGEPTSMLVVAVIALAGALASVSGALAVVWRSGQKRDREHDAQVTKLLQDAKTREEQHGTHVAKIVSEYNQLGDDKSQRQAEEFQRKDEERQELQLAHVEAQREQAAAIDALATAVREGGQVPADLLKAIAQIGEMHGWYESAEDLRYYLRRGHEKDQKKIVAMVAKLSRQGGDTDGS
jgi:hypothetical protein